MQHPPVSPRLAAAFARPPAAPRLRPVLCGVLALLAGRALAQDADGAAPGGEAPLALRATPMLAEEAPKSGTGATFITGEHAAGRPDLEAIVEGNAVLRQPGRVARADRLVYDQTSDLVTFDGRVRVNALGDRYSAESGQLQIDSMEGFFLAPTYELIATGAHGAAERLQLFDADRSRILAGTYTTCVRGGPDWMPDWILRAARIDLDKEAGEGRAQGAVLQFKGLATPAFPELSFPLDERRKSGWLPATVGLDNKSGLNLQVPYYWNIAPNRDATLTPTVMARRGFDLAGEFRYLESAYQGRINANVMPDDRLRDRNRWGYFVRHNGTHDTGIAGLGAVGIGLSLNRVSDNDYWRDFTRRGLSLTTRLLANDAALNWGRGDFSFSARALKWQTLQDVDAPIIPPYDRLPQFTGRWGRLNDRGFDYFVEGDFTRFRADSALTRQPNADRGYAMAQLARPFVRPWGFLTPKVQVHSAHYSFDTALGNGATTASATIPTFSLDSGLVFERQARLFGRALTQTLEPRLMYVYTPYRDQSAIPNYDSGAYDFNFATIWAENAFAGHDRVVDNNLLTGGLTTRLLDSESGAELVRLGLAQRYRFAGQRVVLPGGTPTDAGWSDVMAGATLNWSQAWSFDTVVQYNPDTRRSTRTTINLRYSPGPYHTVSTAYRQQRDLKSESLDLGWQWPLGDLLGRRAELGTTGSPGGGGSCGGRWYGVGRLNYNLRDSRVVDAIAGLEYDAGCWIGRVVFEKLNNSLTSSTKRVLFQLEFVGLSRLGSSPLRTLRNNVPRYQMLREEVVPPSRFTEYE